ncbi:serine/threonine-protein kinase HT1 [Senna tora]|uniref:Serine/threonine-protein kinase HT1 n=1 Tax=Senna tora TaxID=362788 RepID=A0A834X4C6_9FABA|nr:serine/threonine-protein kinase HT1 [Senna tora]
MGKWGEKKRQIDLKTIDEQLERHLNKALIIEKQKSKEEDTTPTIIGAATTAIKSLSGGGGANFKRQRYEWEIDTSKLIIKSVIARGTFGTVHRGIYDGQDVAVKLLDWGEEGHRTEAEINSLRSAFSQEVTVWHKLDHPNVTKGDVYSLPSVRVTETVDG